MNTPICDFVDKYIKSDAIRFHMPGHKGKNFLGIEERDITEIVGADNLFEANGIIKESEENASDLFGCPTFYSTEGSSLCIRAMLYLAILNQKNSPTRPLIAAARNVHKAFLSAAALLDFDIMWLLSKNENTYLSCRISSDDVEKAFSHARQLPAALYLTSPDYLGKTADIEEISKVCHKFGVLLIVDCAHGAYLKFLDESVHPMDLGADMCCASAHKTLPTLTGGAYMHLSSALPDDIICRAKNALSLFASSSPSYLILQSLDKTNLYLKNHYREELKHFISKLSLLKQKLKKIGYDCLECEPLKLTIQTKSYGYTGTDFANLLSEKNIICEFCDSDFIVLMPTPENGERALDTLYFELEKIKKKPNVFSCAKHLSLPKRVLSPREAVFSAVETISAKESLGRIFADSNISCPPAVPIIVCGEVIDENILSAFEYYNITSCTVVKK